MLTLEVWITFESGRRRHAGTLVCAEPAETGRIRGQFRYSDAFLRDPDRFPLDPVALPLNDSTFSTERAGGVFQVFEDSLPDDWGRRLLIRKHGLARDRQTVPWMLRALAGTGLGALAYHEKGMQTVDDPSVSVVELDTLIAQLRCFENNLAIENEELSLLLNAGSSPGGARPKALVKSEDSLLWIAKFPAARDRLSLVPIEAATLDLAARAGLNVPETRVIQSAGTSVLLVRRFDVSTSGGRRHMISFQTLLRAEGYYQLGYRDLFEVLARLGANPETDIPILYRWMVFNAMIGNTDDHLKNFWAFASPAGLTLTPAFDLLPDVQGKTEHVLHFDHGFICPGRRHLVDFGKRLGICRPDRILDQVHQAVSHWKNQFAAAGVPDEDIWQLAPLIDSRLTKV